MTSPSSPATANTRRRPPPAAPGTSAQTRADVLLAAVRLFGRSGGAGTTLAAIAAGAGVAAETTYTGFSSKKALLRAAMAVAIVGDAQPVPLIEPPVLSIAASVTPSSASQAAIFCGVRHALAAAIRST